MTTPCVDIVGIDLGTTNSVIAIPGHFDGNGQIFGPVTVLFDDVQRLIQASAVAVVEGELVVGDDAKAMAEGGHPIVRFWKKYMGTNEKFPVGDEMWSPEQLSAAVLKLLVSSAEKRLGVTIRRAVITHPACFDVLAIKATRDAATAANLDADRTLLMDPVAAAMAYTYEDARPNVRVLVYDLGGGTFDITLVVRTFGKMDPTSFGGNRELGGYNFDKKIATKMLQGLREEGYALKFDADNPQKDPRWTTLLHYAEQVKHKLTDSEKANIRENGVFKDDSSPPKNVLLSFSLTEPEFRTMIEPEIKLTIDETRKVLDKAGMAPSDVDYLVLVGGSSRIPAIRGRLKQEFGLEPQFDEDVLDLSVAAGAAMIAAASGSSSSGVFLNHVPDETDDVTLAISGRVDASETIKDPSKHTVVVTGGASEEIRTQTGTDGGFYVDIELFENEENPLRVTITSPQGEMVLDRSVVVVHNVDASPPPAPPVPLLAKAIFVDTMHSLDEIAPENARLPYQRSHSFRTIAELTEIQVDIYQDDIQLSTLLLRDFSHPIPPRCQVDLTVRIDRDYSMNITANAPAVSITKTQEIKLTPLVMPSSDELREEYSSLKRQYESMLEYTLDCPAKARNAAEVHRLADEITDLLTDEHPERMQLYMLLKKLSVKMKELSSAGKLRPTKVEMTKKFTDARALLPKAEAKDESLRAQHLGATLQRLHEHADRAYATLEAAAWQQISERMDEICRLLKRVVEGGNGAGGGDLAPAPILKTMMDQMLAETKQQFASKKSSLSPTQVEQIQNQLNQAQEKLEAVDIGSAAAQQQIIGVFIDHIKPVNDMTIRSSALLPTIEGRTGQTEKGKRTPVAASSPLVTDQVHFSLVAPSMMVAGHSYVLDIMVHLAEQREQVLQRARESLGDNFRVKSKGGVRVERGSVLQLQLAIAGFEVQESQSTLIWNGELTNETFPVTVPPGAANGPHLGTVRISVNSLTIATLQFTLEVGPQTLPTVPVEVTERRYRSAFASYASEDRDRVLARIQGMQKAVPELNVFVDVASLRSGEKWLVRLEQEIQSRDVLFLFWSKHAHQSRWVEHEWRTALRVHGIAGVDPVPLVSPDQIPPPPELGELLHFNDWVLAYMRG